MTTFEKYQEYPRKTELTAAEDIVFGIVDEMTGRKGIGNAFEECDYETQEEILEKLIKITNEKLDNISA